MKATKITSGEIESLKVASLPTRPTAPTAFGGRGYTASEMKEAFDKLPLRLAEKYNELIESIEALGADSISASMNTGIGEAQSLADIFEDIKDGSIAGYMKVMGVTLGEYLLRLRADIDALAAAVGVDLDT